MENALVKEYWFELPLILPKYLRLFHCNNHYEELSLYAFNLWSNLRLWAKYCQQCRYQILSKHILTLNYNKIQNSSVQPTYVDTVGETFITKYKRFKVYIKVCVWGFANQTTHTCVYICVLTIFSLSLNREKYIFLSVRNTFTISAFSRLSRYWLQQDAITRNRRSILK